MKYLGSNSVVKYKMEHHLEIEGLPGAISDMLWKHCSGRGIMQVQVLLGRERLSSPFPLLPGLSDMSISLASNASRNLILHFSDFYQYVPEN